MKRRLLLQRAAALATAPLLPAALIAQQQLTAKPVARARTAFPKGFFWGTASAAYQVEGAVHEDGRGASIWDTASHTPGKTFEGQTGDVTDDQYHRYADDVALMKRLGVTAYRFSIAWPRVFPQGTGAPNPIGLDYYKRLIDQLHAAGIEPFCTLYHWDLPQALQDTGGWTSRDTSSAFADYAAYSVGQLSDRVSHWITTNELDNVVGGYGGGKVPGVHLSRAEFVQTRHHAVLAHGMAVRAIRASARRPVQVGIAEDVSGVMPALEDSAHIEAAKIAIRERNAAYTTVILEGRYTDKYLRDLGADAPSIEPGDLSIISTPLDFVGLNIYTTREVIPSDGGSGYEMVTRPATYPHAKSDWLYVNPQAMYWTPRLVSEVWGVKNLYITENGYSAADVLRPDGRVLDTDRIMYLHNYLLQLQRCVEEQIPVRGYFLWSILDNFEWGKGFSERFGITYVDFQTEARTPKLSFDFYRRVIEENAVR